MPVRDPFTIAGAVAVLVLSGWLLLAAWRALATVRGEAAAWRRRSVLGPALAVVAGAGALLLYRWLGISHQWQPVAAHVDGLLLMTVLLAAATAYLVGVARLAGVAAGLASVVAVLAVWAVCAASWTYRPFHLETLTPAWRGLHLLCVYSGTAAAGLAAAAGVAYLIARHRLRSRRPADVLRLDAPDDEADDGNRRPAPLRLGSLERLEAVIRHGAILGFTALTLGLITGGIILFGDPGTSPTLTHLLPKIGLSVAAWAAYAVAMNVNFLTAFRGGRAAWIAIGGFVLLLATYSVVAADQGGAVAASAAAPQPEVRR